MKTNKADQVIAFDDELNAISEQLNHLKTRCNGLQADHDETKELLKEVQDLLGCQASDDFDSYHDEQIEALDHTINQITDYSLAGDIHLTPLDILVSVIAGIVATLIDVVFVGTPEVVKIYKGGERFDRSVLTGLIRDMGNDNRLTPMFSWLSDHCKVPYDKSAERGVINPNNHRLRNFAHDPMFGLLFAVADILMGTCTVIDDQGCIRVLINDHDYPESQKYLAVFYYLGHLLSDVSTARGLPVPGFFLTQFIASDDPEESIAKIAEQMYRDGYDLRHFVSMSTPVIVKNLIIDCYLKLKSVEKPSLVEGIASKEIRENKEFIYKYKLRLMSDAVCCSGNVLKFFLPPTLGNITALNIPEWTSLILDMIITLKYQVRDKTVEYVILNREIINDQWNDLLNN